MRGMIAVSLLLVALIVVVGFIGTTASAEKRLRESLQESLQQERVFYAASDIESAFWKTVKAATHESAALGEDSFAFRQRLLDYLSAWNYWASDNYEVDAKVEILTGISNDANSLELSNSRKLELEYDNEMILSTRRDFDIPIATSGETVKVAVYIISVTRTLTSSGIYARVSGESHSIMDSIPAGAQYVCYTITDGAGLIGASGLGDVLGDIEARSGLSVFGIC